MGNILIKNLLRENLKKVENRRKRKVIGETKYMKVRNLSVLLEKKIRVGDNLTKKLNKIDTNLSKNILKFLNSDDIKDSANVEYVDYNKKDEKLFTVGYTDNRGNTKENKFKIAKLLKYLGANLANIKQYEVEELISHLKKGDLDNFKIVDGDDILKVYHCNNYDEGETMGSCMRHEYAQKYLSIYTDNPDQVKVLALINPENGKVRGRALLWNLDNGNVFMDRIYVTNNQYKSDFNSYAEEHGFETGSPSDEVTLDVDGDYNYYPYMDTLKYYTPSTGTLSDTDGEITIQDTGGGSSRGAWSEEMQEFIPDENACYVEHMEDYVYCDDIVMSHNGDDRLYVQSDDVVELTGGDSAWEYALKSEVMTTYDNSVVLASEAYHIDEGDHAGDYAVMDDLMYTFDDKNILHEDGIELTLGSYSGEYAYKGDTYVQIDEDGDIINVVHEDDIDDYSDEGNFITYEKYEELS